ILVARTIARTRSKGCQPVTFHATLGHTSAEYLLTGLEVHLHKCRWQKRLRQIRRGFDSRRLHSTRCARSWQAMCGRIQTLQDDRMPQDESSFLSIVEGLFAPIRLTRPTNVLSGC